MKRTILAVMVLVALAAYKNSVKEQAEVKDLPRAEGDWRESGRLSDTPALRTSPHRQAQMP